MDISEQYLDLLKSSLCASLYDESAWRRVDGPRRNGADSGSVYERVSYAAKHRVLRFLRKRDLMLVRHLPFKKEVRDGGFDWPLFGFTMTGRRRLDALHSSVETILSERIPGDFIETGVWRGGSVILMRALLKIHNDLDRTVWCADSFEGLPPPNETDLAISKNSDFSDRDYLKVGIEDVKANFARFGLLDSQVRFLKGWFSETLPSAPIDSIALLRLDGDLYESTMDALSNLYHKVSKGGFVIVDDYNTWDGCKAAVDEFRGANRILSPMAKIDDSAVLWRV